MRSANYEEYLKNKEQEFENICRRCGRCCGADNDPCANLKKSPDNRYSCAEYNDRLGKQLTVSGKSFTCVSIRTHIREGTLPAGCAYRK